MRRPAHLRLVPVAAATWSAGAVAILTPAAAPAIAAGLWIVALTAVGMTAASRRRSRVVPVIVALALAGAAVAASHVALTAPVRGAAAGFAIEAGRVIDVEATVIGKVERRAGGSLAFDARATRITAGSRALEAAVDIVVRVDPADIERGGAVDVGAVIVARGTAAEARPGERAAFVLWASRGVEVVGPPAGAMAVAADLRHGLVAAVAGLPGEGAGLVPGLAVGDTSAVSPDLDVAMKQSSLSHLTAVSGANCALVVGIAFAVTAALGGSRGARVIVGLAVLGGFVLLVTPEPSVVRAAGMASIAMLAVLLGRTGAGLAMLALAVAVLLALDPWLSASLGFALSVVATASLLLLARPLAEGLGRAMPRPLALSLSIPLAAQLACGPLLVLIDPRVPLYGVAANLLAGPAAPVATVVGLAACLAAPLPLLQAGLAGLAWLPASWIAATATTVTALPAGMVPWFEGWAGALALTAVGAAVAVAIAVRRGPGRARLLLRGTSLALVATVTGVALGGGALSTVAGRWTLPADWSILACDIGQGDAVLLRSAGSVALVDTGPDPAALSACLARAGIDRIDLLALTHFDLDHSGGIAAVVGRVGTVIHGPPDDDGRVAIASLVAAGAHSVEASAGVSGSLGEARWRVLWPAAGSRAFAPGNDASVVLDVRGGGIPAILLLGDLSASPQRVLEASGALVPPYAVVKVAHHGSGDQDAGLYASAAPSLALITVGAGNDYGHPRDTILAVLEDLGAQVTRTDLHGIVTVAESAAGLRVWREREDRVGGRR
ncbi:ComEC/Rec2 family competence protein [Microbacterium cremeum]|uniref:ComEC/Rec2 family competence protein n=1 Tax=Microbacterium cremeum TaxID=2782169 RepID=UPI001887DC80|nr:ComEC/Rec2 family competence protein [Microbacterium cremeum]